MLNMYLNDTTKFNGISCNLGCLKPVLTMALKNGKFVKQIYCKGVLISEEALPMSGEKDD